MTRKLRIALLAIAVILAALVCACAWYVNDYYHADATALEVMADEDGNADGVVVRGLSDKAVAFVPDEPRAGLVFYPGAKVQPESYAPLLESCAERGVLCVLVKPLFNLAILDIGAADGALGQFPDIGMWIAAGHSMGGVAASSYALQHVEEFDAVAFLASYPSDDLAAFEGRTLSLAGSNDHVLNWENFESAQTKLPEEAIVEIIEGGNHAHFGNYGEQAGDGEAAIAREEQQERTADAIAALAEAANESRSL